MTICDVCHEQGDTACTNPHAPGNFPGNVKCFANISLLNPHQYSEVDIFSILKMRKLHF